MSIRWFFIGVLMLIVGGFGLGMMAQNIFPPVAPAEGTAPPPGSEGLVKK